jgi:hypothetical protein
VKPGVKVKRLTPGRILVTATRGAVTTEAVFTEAEADQLWHQLGKILGR